MSTERTKTAAREGFTVRRDVPQHAPTPRMSSRDLWGMASAAAAQVMRGKSYSPDDRADVAAQLVADIIGLANRHPAPRPYGAGTFPLTRDDARMAAVMDRDMSRPATMAARRAEDVFYVPMAARSYVRMTNRALNLRTSLDRQRARDLAAANERGAATDGFTVRPEHECIRPVSPTPEAARDAAMGMLDALGLPRLGKAYPLAYLAARTYVARVAHRDAKDRATGHAVTAVRATDLASAAAELGYNSPEALTMACKRAAAKLPSAHAGEKHVEVCSAAGEVTLRRVPIYSAAAHGSALGIENGATPARKASATRMHSADMGDRANGWRDYCADLAPVVIRRVEPAAAAPPAWTRDLPAATSARLEGAARVKRARMAAKDPAQRAADRLSAGIPS